MGREPVEQTLEFTNSELIFLGVTSPIVMGIKNQLQLRTCLKIISIV